MSHSLSLTEFDHCRVPCSLVHSSPFHLRDQSEYSIGAQDLASDILAGQHYYLAEMRPDIVLRGQSLSVDFPFQIKHRVTRRVVTQSEGTPLSRYK